MAQLPLQADPAQLAGGGTRYEKLQCTHSSSWLLIFTNQGLIKALCTYGSWQLILKNFSWGLDRDGRFRAITKGRNLNTVADNQDSIGHMRDTGTIPRSVQVPYHLHPAMVRFHVKTKLNCIFHTTFIAQQSLMAIGPLSAVLSCRRFYWNLFFQ